MPHGAAGMALMEDPAQGLGEIIRWVDDPRDEFHEDVASIFPVLNGKVLDIDVARALGRDASVDHVDGQLVVTVKGGRSLWPKAELRHDGPQVASMLGRVEGSKEFHFSGAGCCD